MNIVVAPRRLRWNHVVSVPMQHELLYEVSTLVSEKIPILPVFMIAIRYLFVDVALGVHVECLLPAKRNNSF